eukprot:CAMPEP_0197435452 /NCGR_PEP_ID=MMETSP1175-20131217/3040_1 /TAXON_ID=1003142 /ORGANISM="Triceratium dubium, Strain CCMP147" /LENGTH=359 /DNA_ID=CAMNT_0042964493 /DNA_START=207 /DNA_END=1287 /DNA_ORIENTATION=+
MSQPACGLSAVELHRSLFEPSWYNSLLQEQQIAYACTAEKVYNLIDSGTDSNSDDSYQGFAPLLLRSSFHSSGSYDHGSGTGGSNGGTIFHSAELEDSQNGCISTATDKLYELFHGSSSIPLADTVVIAGVVALDTMNFPRMDLIQMSGGRFDLTNIAFRDRLPSPDDNPMQQFMKQYNLDTDELVALIGGGHEFGAAHGLCSGYVGQWTTSPLSWSENEFFPDLLKDDWEWYEVCTYKDGISSFTGIPDPFANGLPEEEEEEEHGEDHDVCAVASNQEPTICEEQAVLDCSIPDDSSYSPDSPPCSPLIMRLKSDFFLKADPELLPSAEKFAVDSNLLAEKFGIAYHKQLTTDWVVAV